MSTHQNIKIDVCDVEQFDDDWPINNASSRLVDVIAWFTHKYFEIPEQYRADARCKIDTRGGYEDDSYAHIEISYERPETNAETMRRLSDEDAWSGSAKAREIDLLKKLQAKYPDVT